MTRAATIRKSDLMRYAEVANEKDCKVIIRLGDTVVTVEPSNKKNETGSIDYDMPIL